MIDSKFLKRLLSFLLCAIFVLSLAGCSSHFTEDGLKVVTATAMGAGFHTSNPEKYQTAMKSGLYELLLDEANCAIAVKDTTGNIWYSLPTAENSIGSLLSIQVTDGSKWFYLNSQDSAVALSNAKCETSENGLKITYNFADKAKDPLISIPVVLDLTLKDGVLVATVDASAVAKKYTIIRVSILPTFGAVSDPVDGDFIVIPDGPGGLISLDKAAEEKYTLDTYGTDRYKVEENEHPTIIGAFGLKKGENAFAGIVTSGDAISKIIASTGTFDYVYSAFTYPANTDKLQVSYKFISGSAANCSSLASMCREQLVRDGMLSTRIVDVEGNLPVNITVTANSQNKIENTEDMMSILKAKGVNALNLRYDGLFKNNTIQSKMGKMDELDSLKTYLSSQGFGFYPTVNLFEGRVTNTDKLSNTVVSFLKKSKKYNFDAYCLGDIGNTLSSTRSTTRQEFASGIFSQSISLSTNKSLMVDTGNLYALKNANIISCLPIFTSYDESEAYSTVPFVQMILRGVVEYSGPYLNEVENYDVALLRCLEYGALPSFNLTFDSDEDNYYENWSQKVLDSYNLFDGALSDLRSAKMTDHKKVQKGLYLSEYNNNTYIYINYNSETVYYNGLTIAPLTYLRVN